jgi:hypothetical protein
MHVNASTQFLPMTSPSISSRNSECIDNGLIKWELKLANGKFR